MCGGFQDSKSPSRLGYGEQGLEGKDGVVDTMGRSWGCWQAIA